MAPALGSLIRCILFFSFTLLAFAGKHGGSTDQVGFLPFPCQISTANLYIHRRAQIRTMTHDLHAASLEDSVASWASTKDGQLIEHASPSHQNRYRKICIPISTMHTRSSTRRLSKSDQHLSETLSCIAASHVSREETPTSECPSLLGALTCHYCV